MRTKPLKTKTLTLAVEPEKLERLTELAEAQDISRSHLVRRLVDAALTENATTTAPESREVDA